MTRSEAELAPARGSRRRLREELAAHTAASADEEVDLARVRALVDAGGDPWSRAAPLHVTGSALVVHPLSGRVLLRWHDRQQAWLQVGGHGDPGEVDPFAVALREGVEETGLADLRPWPGAEPRLVHLVVVPVPPGKGEPAHEHADLRYLLATDRPDDASPESPAARLRWLTPDEADALVTEDNLRVTLAKLRQLLTEGVDD